MTNICAEFLLFIIKAQNAAVTLRKTADGAVLECFELLATNLAVLKASNGLERQFPAQSVRITARKWSDTGFMNELAKRLHMLSAEETACSKMLTKKASSSLHDDRETKHPKLVTQWLFSWLMVHGSANQRTGICKKIRDNVCLDAQHKVPWRRSFSWLACKVTMQLALASSGDNHESRGYYKNFMLFVLSRLALETIRSGSEELDSLHVLRTKLSVRAAKLDADHQVFGFVREQVELAVGEICSLVKRQWTEIRSLDAITVVNPPPPIEIDKCLLPMSSAAELRRALDRYRCEQAVESTTFQPSWPSKTLFDSTAIPSPDALNDVPDGSVLYRLSEVETWIRNDLDQWLDENADGERASLDLFALCSKYLEFGKKVYEKHSVLYNAMLLNVIHLWQALDTHCCRLYELMLSYSPEIPPDFLEALLVAHASDFHRLRKIEGHLRERHGSAPLGMPSTFAPVSDDSFAVKYFEEDKSMKGLYKKIQREKRSAKNQKRTEFKELTAKYIKIKADVYLMEHDHSYGRPRPVNCPRCAKEQESKRLMIEVYEKPLPSGSDVEILKAKALCFEAQCPPAIRAWRDAVFMLLHDLGQPSKAIGLPVSERLHTYTGLKGHFRGRPGRVGLESAASSFYSTRLRVQQIPADEDQVIVNHAPKWRLSCGGRMVEADDTDTTKMAELCSLQLPQGSYKALQTFVSRWDHHQNGAIASQESCHTELSHHEFQAFTCMRAGLSTQWPLMLLNLRSSNLRASLPEVFVLYAQSVLQAGPHSVLGTDSDAHAWLDRSTFVQKLVSNLKYVQDSIQANPAEVNVMRLVILMLMRIINASKLIRDIQLDEDPYPINVRCPRGLPITKEIFTLLSTVRQTLNRWMTSLHSRLGLDEGLEVDEENRLRSQLLSSALLCKETFFLEKHNLDRCFAIRDLSLYVLASIHVFDNSPEISKISGEQRDRLQWSTKGSISLQPHLVKLTKSDSRPISDGVNEIRDRLFFESSWAFADADCLVWVQNVVEHTQLQCHYNLLTGELIVDSKSLQRLPEIYRQNPHYR